MKNLIKEIKITDIEGIRIGNAQDFEGGTGCTAIICEKGAAAGADVRGAAPATRETELLKPINMIESIHCVMLSGGSAYGLAAGDGAMAYLEEKGIGFETGFGVVPIVCGASLFDLAVGDPKARPDKAMGYTACKASEGGNEPERGNAGAGTGAAVGKFLGPDRMMKGGLGIYAAQVGDIKCGAVVAVNCLGDVADTETGQPLAGILNDKRDGLDSTRRIMTEYMAEEVDVFKGNTTIGCIITNGKLTKNQCCKLAGVTHNAYGKAIWPVHTSADGDAVFVMATGEKEAAPDSLGVLAVYVMERAIADAVKKSKSAYGIPAAEEFLK